MSGIRVGRSRGRTAGVALGAMALLAGITAGCTGADDDSESLVVDDGSSAAAVVAGAVQGAADSSGRIDVVSEFDDPSLGLNSDVTIRYAGEDMEVLATMAAPFPELSPGAPEFELRLLAVGGATYAGGDLFGLSPTDGASLPDGVEWVDVTDSESFSTGVTAPEAGELFASLDELSQVTELDPTSIDGHDYRTFGASMSMSAAVEFASGGDREDERAAQIEDEDDAWIARYDAIAEYGEMHSEVEATVLIGEDDSLRRVVLELSSDIPGEFADCFVLSDVLGNGRVVLDITELGDVHIDAPDPSTVISSAEADALVESSVGETSGGADPLTDPSSEQIDHDLVGALQYHAATLGLDPSAVPAMSPDEVVAAAEQLPEVETALGAMSRPGLLATVSVGMSIEGIDPSVADTLTDEQLAELINAYVAEQDGAFFDAGAAGPVERDDFEGCPA